MSALQNNVDALRAQLAQQEVLLEHQKREAREKEDTSWGHNIALLKSIFEPLQIQGEKEIAKFKKDYEHQFEYTNTNIYRPGLVLTAEDELVWKKKVSDCQKRYDKEISHWRKPYEKDVALYHLLNRLDESMSHIENVITTMDERLTHIEELLGMMK